MPPDGAGPEIVTVPADTLPATIVVGLRERLTSVGPITDRLAVLEDPFSDAPIVAVWFAARTVVAMLKYATFWPLGMVTVEGTVTPYAVLSLDRATTNPAGGASPVIATPPCEEVPPRTDVGLNCKLRIVDGMTTSCPVSVVEPCVALMVAVMLDESPVVKMLKKTIVCPDWRVTVEGTVTPLETLLLLRATVIPADVGGPEKVRMPIALFPLLTDVGVICRLINVGASTVSGALCVDDPTVALIFAVRLDATGSVVTSNVPVV